MFSFLRKCCFAAVSLTPALVWFAGCMTPEKARREADEMAGAAATEIWREQTGFTNAFDIARAADSPALTNADARISLAEALRIGALRNRKYQSLKETVYQRALAMDNERYAFDNTFSGFLLGALTGSPEINKDYGEAGIGAKRKFENGASLAGNMALDVTKMIREDWHSFGWVGELSAGVPLLRGSSREIVREPLTQAERNLVYSVLTFDRYRQTYALSLAKSYYNVLQYAQTKRNSDDNVKRLDLNWRRAEMMFKAGRMDRIQVDQARTDLLSARQGVITSQKSYEAALDNFKISLGLAPELPLALDDAELEKMQKNMQAKADEEPDALSDFPQEHDAMKTALESRLDLSVTRGDVFDSERAVKVAADNLRGEITVEGKADYAGKKNSTKSSVDDDIDTSLKIRWSAPWDRRRERNAYRKALIALDQSKRALEESEDAVKNEVRAGYRDLVAARALYENKVESYKVAKMRVDAIDLFTQSGRSSMRDTLDAARDLLSAQNALCSAVIEWRMSDLSLRTAMGVLKIDEDGTWMR